jgi:hypothetical protein
MIGYGNSVFLRRFDSVGVIPPPSFLLDTYPSAAAAYSLRKLSSTYSGNAIRVRRSSDNAEQNIGFVSNVLDTASLLTFCGAGNGFVTTWYDQSGNARNTTQTTAINQPYIVFNGSVLIENSKPILSFDGSNDSLKNITTLSYTDFSLFSVNRFVRIQPTGELLIQYSKIDIAQVGINLQSSDTGIATIASYPFSDVGISLLKLHTNLTTVSGATTTSTLFLNNTQKATGNRNLTSTKNTISIAASDTNGIPGQVSISEIILYPTSQSANRTNISNNINTFYSLY